MINGLMINAGMLFVSSRRLIYGGHVIALGLTGKFVHCQVRANETSLQDKRQFSNRNRAVLLNVQSPHKLWSTLKSAVFGTRLSLPLLVSEGGGQVCESVDKADLLSDHFDSKHSREAVDQSLTHHLSPSLITFAVR